MWTRCTWTDGPNWRWYGGRGIGVCDRWRSFATFLEDVGPRPSREYSLDRIDPDRDYEPGNVRWATQIEQNRNRRNSVRVDVGGVPMSPREAALALGIGIGSVVYRLQTGALKKFASRCGTAPEALTGRTFPR
jgi:hypothetical protein